MLSFWGGVLLDGTRLLCCVVGELLFLLGRASYALVLRDVDFLVPLFCFF
jgi:hypothetical protein